MPRPPAHRQVSELELRVSELEQRLARLSALHRVAQSISKSPTPSRVLVELARELGAAVPRVYEVSVAAWDRRRNVIRDIFEFKPQQNRRIAVPGHEFELAGLPELHHLLRAGRGTLVSLRDGVETSDAQVAYMKRFGWYSLLPTPLFERIRHMADHDPLTGLVNPRVFHRRAGAAERAARRNETPLGVLVMDIDDFKRVNDEQGHAHGDRVLRDTAAFEREEILVSIGLAVLPGTADGGVSLVESADMALLRAKRHGKRRIERAA